MGGCVHVCGGLFLFLHLGKKRRRCCLGWWKAPGGQREACGDAVPVGEGSPSLPTRNLSRVISALPPTLPFPLLSPHK